MNKTLNTFSIIKEFFYGILYSLKFGRRAVEWFLENVLSTTRALKVVLFGTIVMRLLKIQ